MDEIAESVNQFIERNITPYNLNIQDESWSWAQDIVEHLRNQGYLKD